MNDRNDSAVVEHLEAENRYTDEVLAGALELRDSISEEIRGRIKQDDTTVPVRIRDYWYYVRTEDGRPYPIHCRRPGPEGDEEILLDVNDLAEGRSFCQVSQLAVRTDQMLFAAAIDFQGRRQHSVRFYDLREQRWLEEELSDCSGAIVWAEDDQTLFYVKKDPVTLRSDRLYRHRLGTDPAEDELLYQETDETFHLSVSRSVSREYIFLHCEHTLRSEVHFLRSNDPQGRFEVFLPRQGEHEYNVDHHGGHFFVISNDEALNFRVFRVADEERSRETWVEIIAHRDNVLLDGLTVFDDFLVTEERCEGLVRFGVHDHDGRQIEQIPFADPAYAAWSGANPEPSDQQFRYHYSSMGVPASVYEYDLKSHESKLLKRDEVKDFESSDYVTERHWATARDGAEVPISLVRRRDTPMDGSAPCVLYGYGSYGLSLDASFSAGRISLLDRGFVFALAHVRGGSELGRRWYDDGKKLKKWNTFHDFIDCAEELLRLQYTQADRLYCWGGSAGGMLVGCVMNERPELFHAVVAEVPFVDVVTTMLDDSIPLTTGEYDEWGNPNDREYFEYMLSYSPYDQVREQAYPHLLVHSGFHDSQVQYWEPTKWVARLRDKNTGDSIMVLRTNMAAGHGGASGRYERYREIALSYAFLIDRARKARGDVAAG
jgi:oligopeptidase B